MRSMPSSCVRMLQKKKTREKEKRDLYKNFLVCVRRGVVCAGISGGSVTLHQLVEHMADYLPAKDEAVRGRGA